MCASPAARQDDPVVGVDAHIVLVPGPSGAVPTPLPHPFSGRITAGTVPSVVIEGKAAAVVGSTVTNDPKHVPTPPGTSFARAPANRGTVDRGSATVLAGGKPLARALDPVRTCNDPVDSAAAAIQGGALTVEVGG